MLQSLFWTEFFTQLGPMGWPLLGVSALSLALLVERLWYLLRIGHLGIGKFLQRFQGAESLTLNQLAQHCEQQQSLASKATALLLQHRDADKNQRDEIAGVWLQGQRRQLHSGLRLLMVLGIISPLLGLLGTVLGLIEMFSGLSGSDAPVTPALLADGLGMALSTTAAGLLVALPAIFGAHVLAIWSDRIVADLEYLFNCGNLSLEGRNPSACRGTDSNQSGLVATPVAAL